MYIVLICYLILLFFTLYWWRNVSHRWRIQWYLSPTLNLENGSLVQKLLISYVNLSHRECRNVSHFTIPFPPITCIWWYVTGLPLERGWLMVYPLMVFPKYSALSANHFHSPPQHSALNVFRCLNGLTVLSSLPQREITCFDSCRWPKMTGW